MPKVKIFGAGSIGNHLSHACRHLGWQVDLCDLDAAALERTRTEIYPQRYGEWDDEIGLFNVKDAPKEGYDFIFVGTPPDSHIEIALEALEERPKALLVEKPLCRPNLSDTQLFWDRVNETDTMVFVGYDHAIGQAAEFATTKLPEIGNAQTLDFEFREHWGGIFIAHPWLSGPEDSYLGYWERGGGALGEHSHAIHLWQHFAKTVGAGKIKKVSAQIKYVKEKGTNYDSIGCLTLTTENGLMGRVIQDVITQPTRKWGRIQGSNGALEWHAGHIAGGDQITIIDNQNNAEKISFAKTRPDDFIKELQHIESVTNGNIALSPISLESGLDTMLIIAAAHKSAMSGQTVTIDYKVGYNATALNEC